MYLLDTSTLVHILRGHPGVGAHLATLPRTVTLYTSVIAEGELLVGAYRMSGARRERELAAIREILQTMTVLPCTSVLADRYGRVRAPAASSSISRNDGWIAATAIERKLILVADDEDYSRVPGLVVENWAR